MTDLGPWPDDDDGALADLEAERWMVAAMMHAPEAFDLAVDGGWRPGDSADGRHDEVALAVAAMLDERRRVDPVTLRARMGDGAVPPGFLDGLFRLPAVPSEAGAYAAKVHEAAVRRRLAAAGTRLRAGAVSRSVRLADVLAAGTADLEAAAGGADAAAELEDPLALAGDEQAKAHQWVIPGVVDRGDRVIVVGDEGSGKTTWGWQVAVAAAAGVHPFWTSYRIPPRRALIVDLEVDRGIRARNFAMYAGPAEAAGIDRGLLRVWARPYGLDLRTADGQMTFTQVVRRHRPDILVAGPMYKMGCTEAEKPGEYKLVSDFLDRLRVRFGCALWLEQHAPMAQGGRPRELRPIGSVLWKQWPEFGFGLAPERTENRFALARFRKDRERGRAWPDVVYWNPGHGWPWLADYAAGQAPGTQTLAAAEAAADLAEQDRRDELAAKRRAANSSG